MTPLVDVVFLLLIFFLVTSQFTEPAATLDLPTTGESGREPEREALRVEVMANGEILVNGSEVEEKALESVFAEAVEGDSSRRVEFYGDAGIDYGRFVSVLDGARAAGVTNFAVVRRVVTDEGAP